MKNTQLSLAALIIGASVLAGCSDSNQSIDFQNASPVVGATDKTISANQTSAPIVVAASDDSTPDGELVASVSSADQSLVRDQDLVLSGFSNTKANLTVTPVTGMTGSVVISLSVTDNDNATTTKNFTLTVVNQKVSADGLIRSVYANAANSEPASLEAIEVVQDVTDVNQYNDLIDSVQ